RIALADQAATPLTIAAAAPVVTPLAPVANPAPTFAAPPAAAPSSGNAYVGAFDALPSRQALELWAAAGAKAPTQATADQARFDAALPAMPVVLAGSAAPTNAG